VLGSAGGVGGERRRQVRGSASATVGDPTRYGAERDNTRALELKEVLGEVLG
jgi:hypothetical protein